MGQPSPTVENLTRSHTLPALHSTTAPTPAAPRYGPPDASLAPRYTGIKTFARCPHVSEPDGVDVAVVGVPFDTATGRPVDHLTEAHHSLRDAELAIERLGYEPGRLLLAFEDFDLGTLLVSEAPMERIDPKVEELLAPLRAHPLLLDAIEAYFEHEMDITRTAQALCLHPNTLRYRLGRLEQLLDLSLKQPSAIAALYIAMMARERSPR